MEDGPEATASNRMSNTDMHIDVSHVGQQSPFRFKLVFGFYKSTY
jgi:hypothetical protein